LSSPFNWYCHKYCHRQQDNFNKRIVFMPSVLAVKTSLSRSQWRSHTLWIPTSGAVHSPCHNPLAPWTPPQIVGTRNSLTFKVKCVKLAETMSNTSAVPQKN
jgi:hypothetical protein